MKKGFTIIELIVSISLISIITISTLISLKGFKELKVKSEMDYSVSSIIEFINCCKSFSRSNNCSTIVMINEDQQEIQLVLNTKKIRAFKLPKDIKITSNDVNIIINNFGKTSDACTIVLKYENNSPREITLKVGTGYVSEKK